MLRSPRGLAVNAPGAGRRHSSVAQLRSSSRAGPCSSLLYVCRSCSEVLDSMWKPSKFSKAFAWSQVYVTGILTWPNAAFTFLAFPALAYKFGEGPSPN